MIHFPSAIQTERITLRPWRASDAAALWTAVDESRDHLAAYMPWVAFYTDQTAAHAFIAGSIREWSHGFQLPLAMIEQETGRIIGASGYHSDEPTGSGWRSLEIGYWLRQGEEGKGFMREAVRAQIRLAFELGVERLQLVCDARNQASYRVAEACGFRREAMLRRDTRTHRGELRDTRIYGLLPDEARVLAEAWADERFELEWELPPFARTAAPQPHIAPHEDKPELPVILTELLRLDPVNLHERGNHYTVVDRSANRHLGLATIDPRALDVPSFSLRWTFRDPDEPIEFGIELILALLKIAFEELAAERVHLLIPPDSEQMREIAEIAGFVNEGTVRSFRSPIDGVIGDYVIYSVIKDDL
jgi:RimJ/RimL family protein N-acetyltransferase